MNAVIPTPTTRLRVLGRLRTAAIVAVLACASNGAYAAFASVLIDDFFFTATPGNGTSFLFAPDAGQFWDLRTFAGGAQTDLATGSRSDFLNVTDTATGPQASATVSSFPIAIGGLNAPSFRLTATANPVSSSGVLYEASGLMSAFGSLCFYDEALDLTGAFDGTSAFCTGSGMVDFSLQYDLEVEQGPGAPPTSAFADITVTGTGVPNGGSFNDKASTVDGISSKFDQQLFWTANLAAGDAALFDITGTVVVQATPEPGVLTLMALGLVGLAATRRRHARAVS